MGPNAAHEGQGLSCGSSSCAESVLIVGNKLLPSQHPFRDLQFLWLSEEVCRSSDPLLPFPVFYSNSRSHDLPAASASGSKGRNTISRHTVRAVDLARVPSISSNYSRSRNIPIHIHMQKWVGRDMWGVAGIFFSFYLGWLLRKLTFKQSPEDKKGLEIWLVWSMQKAPPVKCPNSKACQGSLRLGKETGVEWPGA